MEQKRVSFAIAKAIKKAGYPQGDENTAWYNENGILVKPNVFNGGKEIADAPTYFNVLLWFCKEKNFKFELKYNECACCWHCYWDYHFECGSDPETAIIAAIEHLVTNNLIK